MFAQAMKSFKKITLHEKEIGVEFESILFHHEERRQKCIICFHGYTAAPPQFLEIGKLLFDQGYNVYIPRLTLHGFADKSTDTSSLTSAKLKEHLDKSIEIAQNLGNSISIIGLSLGGVLGGLALNKYKYVESIVLISPAFAFNVGPKALKGALAGALKWMPQQNKKWGTKENFEEPPYCYDGYSTLALRAILEIAKEVKNTTKARTEEKNIFLLLNDSDESICNVSNLEYAENWQRSHFKTEVLIIPKFYHLPHDFISPGKSSSQRKWLYNLITSKI
jgi:esterase/lipase